VTFARRSRLLALAAVTLAAADTARVPPASAQTSSWVSRVEGGGAGDAAPPPGTLVVPRGQRQNVLPPGAVTPSPRQAPLSPRVDQKGTPLKPSKPVPVAAPTASTTGGNDPAYVAFDNGHFLTALKLAEQAAARSEPEAHTLIARIHAEGHGVPRNPTLAAQWYQRAGELGDPDGLFSLALMHIEGRGVKKDIDLAAALFEKAAMKGHVWANYNLGMMFLSGRGKPENPIRGAQHIAYAAEKGIAAAQYDMATMFATGHGVPPDAYMASRWLRRAADLGMAEAQLEYAVMLLRGQGLNADRPDAMRFLRRAAEQGLAGAQNRLAHALLEGLGGPKNTQEAALWRALARDQGLPDDVLDAQIRRLPAAERAAAEAKAAEWLERSAVGIREK